MSHWKMRELRSKLRIMLKLFCNLNFRRNCYLKHERQLKFFKIYTKNNCEQECLSNFTVKTCGCAQFYMISELISYFWIILINNWILGDNSTRICMAIEKDCYDEAKLWFESEGRKSCECLPPCRSIKYSVEIKDKAIKKYFNTFFRLFRNCLFFLPVTS